MWFKIFPATEHRLLRPAEQRHGCDASAIYTFIKKVDIRSK